MKADIINKAVSIVFILCLLPFLGLSQWNKDVRIINLHDSIFYAKREPFEIRTFGDSGVSIFGAAFYQGLTTTHSRAIEAEVNSADGSFIRSSSPSGLSGYNGYFSKVAFAFPNHDRLIVHNRILNNSDQFDTVVIKETSSDSVITTFEGDWKVLNHQETTLSSEAWLYRKDSTLVCKRIDLTDGSLKCYIDLSLVLDDSLFGTRPQDYSLKNIILSGSNLVTEFTRANPSFIDPITGSFYFEQATFSIDTSSLSISKKKYQRIPSSQVSVFASSECEDILYLDESSVKGTMDTTIRRSLVFAKYQDDSSINISYRAKFYINILGAEKVPGNVIYTQNGYYLIFIPTLNFPPNGRVLDGVRLVLFDSIGRLVFDVETKNEWLHLYFNQARISKRGEVYFNIQEERPSENIILGKIDLAGTNPLFRKSPLSIDVVPDPNILVSLYPNPALKFFEVASDSALDEISIVNSLGDLVYTAEIKGYKHLVVTESFARGIYIVRIRSKSGKMSHSKLLLK
ncbi:T9SS type A sorting domain-containing protein [Croceimicrobium hydrocarbonivorans]|uniref:T9SS type A sorting domain-containing protein n=1 Tax=Croceimicrobium hydrocarbonivorans TaxID=2761580 RepID=A0A7H0VCL2_9FLAO|nr:T9SS type A sorting domain-containing protein [Croceimicrobium hydrocarbonivorans]QNR23460.1 T9SS type A sorting domain-containing protein [Croceimicrobium hydrocarbonivorans]